MDHGLDRFAVDLVGRLAARPDRDGREPRQRARQKLEQRQLDALARKPIAQPAAPRILAGAAGKRHVSAVPGGGHRHVAHVATEVRDERVTLAHVLERSLADEIDEHLAEAQRGRPRGRARRRLVANVGRRVGRRLGGGAAHARGRYPRRRVRVDEHTISLDDSPVFYRSAEASGMPTLYLHGIPTSSDDWADFLAHTGGIAPDLIGFGRSGKGGHLDYSPRGLAGFVERLLAHLGVEEVKLVGHDWGATVGLTFAERNPGRVRRMVLCNPPPLGGSAEWPRVLRLWRTRGVGELLMGAMNRALLARTLRRGSVRSDAWPDARVRAVWNQFDQGTQRAILRLVRSGPDDVIGGCGPRPAGGAGAEVTVLWGEQDPWYPPAVADAYAAHLPGATVERVAGAGHWPWLDRPEVVDRVAALLEG